MMSKVWCPISRQIEWANESGKDSKLEPRCTKCGGKHPRVKQQ